MKERMDSGWRFYPGGEDPFFGVKGEGIPVDLPHDFSIIQKRDPHALTEASHAFYPGGIGLYRKSIFVPEDWKEKKVSLEFEGVYMNATVRINGQLIARHPYGYTTFFCDLTPYLKFGCDNEIRVNVNNGAVPNSRWYSGSGIYRHVWLHVHNPVRIAPWGICVTTPEISSGRAAVSVRTTLLSGAAEEKVTLRCVLEDDSGKEAASGEQEISLPANGKAEINRTLTVASPKLWDIDTPHLYTLKSQVFRDGVIVDEAKTSVGIRSISFDAKHGFRLNGRTVKLKGGCIHHDCGILGAAAYDRAEERKVELHKANGFNAIRCAHNPPSPAFLDACDRLGILVIDEAFDCWRETKNHNDYGVFFEEHWKDDMASMVLRDRNHPCVILWSTGNEIVERDGRSDGYRLAKELADFVRSLDPTRAVTNALCPIPHENDRVDEQSLAEHGDRWGELTEAFAEPLDVTGYNYLLHRYEYDGKKYPGRVICGTETYPDEALENWSEVERLPHVIGDFVWTSIDYLGESGLGRFWYGKSAASWLGDYPWLLAYCGDIDVCGIKRPQSYYRDCVWGISKAPYIAVHNPEHYGEKEERMRWGWPDVDARWDYPQYEGKPVAIDVYCADSEVELFLNGNSLRRGHAGKAQRYTAVFDTLYEPGELVAVGLTGGKETSRTVLRTAGKPVSIRLRPDRTNIHAQAGDLSYITVELTDADGNVAKTAENELFFTVCGAGSLIAVGSSDPKSEESYTGNRRKLYRGRAMAIVRSNGEAGEIALTVTADGLPPASVTLKAE